MQSQIIELQDATQYRAHYHIPLVCHNRYNDDHRCTLGEALAEK